jgi:hypothetical protein
MAEAVVHADETSGRVAGTLWWFHVVCTKTLTLLVAHRRRGRQAIDDIGVLGHTQATLVHDVWPPTGPTAHATPSVGPMLRDLAAIAEVPGWRTEDGIKAFADVRSYIDTGRKHGQNPPSILTQLLTTGPLASPLTG